MDKFFELSKKIFWKEKKEIIEKLSEDLNIQLIYVELLILLYLYGYDIIYIFLIF